MKELDDLRNLEKVEAPENFEQGVKDLLLKREKRRQKARVFRFSLAGAAGTLAIILIVANLFFFHGQRSPKFAGENLKNSQDLGGYFSFGHESRIPITEAVDYSGEIREKTNQDRTIYILEQVSDSTDKTLKY